MAGGAQSPASKIIMAEEKPSPTPKQGRLEEKTLAAAAITISSPGLGTGSSGTPVYYNLHVFALHDGHGDASCRFGPTGEQFGFGVRSIQCRVRVDQLMRSIRSKRRSARLGTQTIRARKSLLQVRIYPKSDALVGMNQNARQYHQHVSKCFDAAQGTRAASQDGMDVSRPTSMQHCLKAHQTENRTETFLPVHWLRIPLA
jgi:hypothetical protein